ncbi:septum formation family protein [Actinotalea solisilvae]|uniref:septum formation family protein n=1 Tax=Actinotalea solisilvae TaxID=2072922 RepID=UPI0018F1F222|nr:septum formation family protein [Actinotalea solisilvae]
MTAVTVGASVALALGGCSVIGDALAGDAAQPVRDASGVITEEGDVDAMALRIGDCLTLDWEDPDAETVEVWTVHVTPCKAAHESEAYAATSVAGDSYPGEDAVLDQSEDFCMSEFASFVGMEWESSELDFTYLYPTVESWKQLDDREILCIANDPAGGVVGSLAQAQR